MNGIQKLATVRLIGIALTGLSAFGAVAEAQTVLRYNEGSPNRGLRAQALQYFADRVGELDRKSVV